MDPDTDRSSCGQLFPMEKPDIQASELNDIRQEIDSIDEQIVELLCARFAASEKVRLAKTSDLLSGAMPYRPGREAVILRRLVEVAAGRVPLAVIERVWRSVMSASVLAQADVRIVTIAEVMNDQRYRQATDLFASLVPIEKAGSLKAALGALSEGEQVLVVVPMKLDWRGVLDETPDGKPARVVGVLTAGSDKPGRSLAVLGHAPSEPTGEDETLLVTTGKLPRDFVPKPIWHLKLADDVYLTSIPGYLEMSEQPLVSLKGNSGLGLRIAGRYPSAMELNNQ